MPKPSAQPQHHHAKYQPRRWIALLAWTLMISLVGLTGCVSGEPGPETTRIHPPQGSQSQPAETLTPPAGKPKMGSFNLNKRHGLGGWNKKSGPSETQLMEGLTRLEAEPPQGGTKPTSAATSSLPSTQRSTRHVQ